MGLARPISLKNESIEAIRAFAPEAVFGAVVHDTTKGSVVHVRPPGSAVSRAAEAALPAWVVSPRFEPGTEAHLDPWPKARAFMDLVDGSFNYHVHGRDGFAALCRLVDSVDCYRFSYGRLEDAVRLFDRWG